MRSLVILLIAVSEIVAQEHSTNAPAPLWPGEERALSGYKGQYVFTTQNGNEVVVVLPGENGNPSIVHVNLHRDIGPLVEVSISGSPGNYSYKYTIGNGVSAKDRIRVWSIIVPAADANLVMHCFGDSQTGGWAGSPARAIVAKQSELPQGIPLGRYATWLTDEERGKVAPGTSLGGFEIDSPYKPGFTTAFFSNGETLNLPQDWPEDVFKQLAFLEDRAQREKAILTIGPMFSESASVHAVIDNFQAGIQRSIAVGRLTTRSPFVAELIEMLQNEDLINSKKMRNPPRTGFEQQIAQAAEFTLGLTIEK